MISSGTISNIRRMALWVWNLVLNMHGNYSWPLLYSNFCAMLSFIPMNFRIEASSEQGCNFRAKSEIKQELNVDKN